MFLLTRNLVFSLSFDNFIHNATNKKGNLMFRIRSFALVLAVIVVGFGMAWCTEFDSPNFAGLQISEIHGDSVNTPHNISDGLVVGCLKIFGARVGSRLQYNWQATSKHDLMNHEDLLLGQPGVILWYNDALCSPEGCKIKLTLPGGSIGTGESHRSLDEAVCVAVRNLAQQPPRWYRP